MSSVKGSISPLEFSEISKQFIGLIELKNRSEYQPDLMSDGDAVDAVKRASRILSKAKSMLGGQS